MSFEITRSLGCKDGETEALIIGFLDLFPGEREGEGLFEPNVVPKEVLVTENLKMLTFYEPLNTQILTYKFLEHSDQIIVITTRA